MKRHTMNYSNTFIAVAEGYPKRIAEMRSTRMTKQSLKLNTICSDKKINMQIFATSDF